MEAGYEGKTKLSLFGAASVFRNVTLFFLPMDPEEPQTLEVVFYINSDSLKMIPIELDPVTYFYL